jgi:flagellar biosynthesis/type III secretory pathway chaperone
MEKAIDELTGILEKEIQLHGNLINTAGCINKSILASDLNLLQQHTNQYDEQIYELEKVEDDRLECCKSLSGLLGFGENHPAKLSRIISKSPVEQKAKLEQVRTVLRKHILELAKVNTSNRILLENSLGIINNEFNMIRNAVKRPTGYHQKGHTAYSSSSTTFINRVA